MKTLLLFLLAGVAPAGPLLITGGSFVLGDRFSNTLWSFVGDGFSAQGSINVPTFNCGGDEGVVGSPTCFAPFQLFDPLGPYSPFRAENGFVTLGEKSYAFGSINRDLIPWAFGMVFLSPQGTLPTVTAAGTYDALFDVGGTFCVTDDPHGVPNSPFDAILGPGCVSLLGTAVADYRVTAQPAGGPYPESFFQFLPTIEILPAPEPGTWLMGIPLLLGFLFAAKVRLSLPGTPTPGTQI
jgi:hypothetical protein